MSATGWILVVGVVALVLVAALLAWPVVATALQAHRDYRRARGTAHQAEIERLLGVLDQRIAEERSAIARLEHDLDDGARAEELELDRALAAHLVRTRLDDVPGVGPTRVEAITETVFRGQLRDLMRADEVPGIGPQIVGAITAWVTTTEAEWPRLRSAGYAGKDEIVARYAHQRAEAERACALRAKRIAELDAIATPARATVIRLRRVTPGRFRQSLRGRDGSDALELRDYMLGAFPPWEQPPTWYAALAKLDQGTAKG